MRLGLHCSRDRVTAAVFDRGAIRLELSFPVTGREPLDDAEAALEAVAAHPDLSGRSDLVSSVTFLVSEILAPDTVSPTHLIRVSPRRQHDGHDPVSLPWLTDAVDRASPRIIHLPGGHDARGQEIVQLDTSGLAELDLPAAEEPRCAITAVGSLLNPEHEFRAAEALIARFPAAEIEYAHQFHHTSFAVRERTASVNLALRDRADAIATALSVAANRSFPQARLLVATNAGGSFPLTRLAVTPVDAVAAVRATEAIGAAAMSDANDGTLRFDTDQGVHSCELTTGLPSVVPALLSTSFGKLATPASNVRPDERSPVNSKPLPDPPPEARRPTSGSSLGALGAAHLPRVDWLMTLIQVANETEMIRARHAAESRLHARLVSTGMPPESVRTVDSLVTATSYGNPGVIALRIRAVAEHNDLHKHAGLIS